MDLIATRLRQAIFDGTLPPGSPLAEAELAEQLGVSRGPLREAAQRLVQENLLSTTRRRGLTVTVLDAAAIADVYLARAAVERAACRRLLRNGTGPALRALTRVHQRMVRAAARQDARALGDADIEFHHTLVDAAHSPRLSRMLATLLVETRLGTFSVADRFRVPTDIPDSHLVLVEALRRGDEARLLAEVDGHMADAVRRLGAAPLPDAAGTIDAPAPAGTRPLDPLDLP